MYRINYGNGQVSGTYTSLKAAVAELRSDPYRTLMWIERYDAGYADEPGDWFTTVRGRDLEGDTV